MDEGKLMLNRLKNKIKRVVDRYTEEKYLNAIIAKKKGIYEFSNKDLELYKIERKTILPVKKVISFSDNLKNISIAKIGRAHV